MNVRVEVRRAESWDQPAIVVHPDPDVARKLAVIFCDAIYRELGKPARATIGDNPDNERWAEGEIVYSRGC